MFGDLDWPLNASRGFLSISWASCFNSFTVARYIHEVSSSCFFFQTKFSADVQLTSSELCCNMCMLHQKGSNEPFLWLSFKILPTYDALADKSLVIVDDSFLKVAQWMGNMRYGKPNMELDFTPAKMTILRCWFIFVLWNRSSQILHIWSTNWLQLSLANMQQKTTANIIQSLKCISLSVENWKHWFQWCCLNYDQQSLGNRMVLPAAIVQYLLKTTTFFKALRTAVVL